jgi:RluA family pseudouridine synthase
VDVLYVDDSIIVLNKPAGLPVLPDGWERSAPYLVRMLEEQFLSAPSSKIWVVHRLDKSTSGVMVFARNAQAHRALNIQFEARETDKVYHAIVGGVPTWDEQLADQPLRVDVGHKHRTAVDPARGKHAETGFRVLHRYPAHALLEAHLMTGRTHQIRAHAAALGHALLGDTLYGAAPTELIARPALHAYRLTILNPQTERRGTFTAPYPEDFADALRRLND